MLDQTEIRILDLNFEKNMPKKTAEHLLFMLF